MSARSSLAVVAIIVGLGLPADVEAYVKPPARPEEQVLYADAVVFGKVTEIENDQVQASPYPGAPEGEIGSYKVAVVKLGEGMLAARGLTRVRIGFEPTATARAGRPRKRNFEAVGLDAGQEGWFILQRHHEADFYVIVFHGEQLHKADKTFEADLAEVKKWVKAIEDPVAALQAKDLADRFHAGCVLLRRYSLARSGKDGKPPARERIPAEENRLLVRLLAELPWEPREEGDREPRSQAAERPCRRALWKFLDMSAFGFKEPEPGPTRAGEPPVNFEKLMDEVTTKFLKANADKIVLTRYVRK